MVANIRGVFITGASGFLGSSLVDEFINRGIKVSALVRSDEKEAELRKKYSSFVREGKIRIYRGDVTQPENGNGVAVLDNVGDLGEISNQNEAVVDCAGLVNFMAKKEDLKEVNIKGSKNVVRLVRQINDERNKQGLTPLEKFVKISTAYVNPLGNGDIREGVLMARDSYPNSYEWSKRRSIEHLNRVRRRGIFNGTLVDVISPGIIVGSMDEDGDHGGKQMTFNGYSFGIARGILQAHYKGNRAAFMSDYEKNLDPEQRPLKVRLIGNPEVKKRFLWNDEVARRSVALVLRENDPHGRNFHIVGEPISGHDIQKTLNAILPVAQFRYVGDLIPNPTEVEQKIMDYTGPFAYYTLHTDSFLTEMADYFLGRAGYVPYKMSADGFTNVINRFVMSDIVKKVK